MIWRIFVVGALVIVVAMSLFNRQRRPAPDQPATQAQPPQPGYYMDGARIVETGTTDCRCIASKPKHIQQNPADSSIEMEDLTLATAARSARLDGDRAHGLRPTGLEDARPGRRCPASSVSPQPDALPAVIRTERLTLDTESNIATTRDRVDIEWGSRRLSTMGLVGGFEGRKAAARISRAWSLRPLRARRATLRSCRAPPRRPGSRSSRYAARLLATHRPPGPKQSDLPISLDAASSEFDYRNNTLLFRQVRIVQGTVPRRRR